MGGISVAQAMSYATLSDLRARYGAGEIDDLASGEAGRIDAALADATAEIDGVLGRAFALPLAGGAYPALRAICCDLARQRLYDDAPTDAVADAARRARALLAAMADGAAALLDADGGAVPRRALAPAHVGPAPVMTAARLAGLR